MGQTSIGSGIFKLFTHPVIAFIGTLTGVIGIPLAVWTYYQQIPSRAMAALEPSFRTVFVNRDVPATLQVHVKGSPVTNQDIFAVQFAIWNRGNQSIRPENVLEPIILSVTEGTRIVEATIIRETRSVCASKVSVSTDESRATIDWRIYEPDDGVIVQLMLVGKQDCAVGLSGTIEGGGKPRYVRIEGSAPKATGPSWSRGSPVVEWIGVVALFLVFVFVGSSIIRDLRRLWIQEQKWRIQSAISLACGIIGVGFGVYSVWHSLGKRLMDDKIPSALVVQVTPQ